MSLKDRINDKINDKKYSDIMKFPVKNLMIEVTNCCNNKCIFCYNSCMKRKKKFIDKDLCLKVLRDAYKLGSREVGFYVTGEPLLDNRLSEFIKYAKDIGFNYIYLTTNGILADLDRVKDLYNNGLNSIKFSINSSNSNDYLFIHGTDNFNKVIGNLSDIYNWKKSNNINLRVYVSCVLTKYTNNIEEYNNIFSNICDEFVTMNAINQGGLLDDISNCLSDKTDSITVNNSFNLPCNYPFNSVIVTAEGYLTGCCMDFENLLAYADLNKESLEEAWNNKYIKKLRDMHIKKDVDGTICKNCICSCKDKITPLRKDLCMIDNNLNLESHIKERCEKYGYNC